MADTPRPPGDHVTRHPTTTHPRRAAAIPVLVLLVLPAVLAGCTGDPGPDAAAPTRTPGESRSASEPGPASSPPTAWSPEEQAAADAEAAYRQSQAETNRHTATAVREAAQRGGEYVRTPDLDAILTPVLTDGEFQSAVEFPAVLLAELPGMVDSAGIPEVLDVEIDSVELYDEPRTVDGREAVTGIVVLRSCVDVTSIRPLGADGQPLDPDPTAPRIQTETVTVSRQPQSQTGQVGWYVAEVTNTEGPRCELPR
jgi:hypothetical protein